MMARLGSDICVLDRRGTKRVAPVVLGKGRHCAPLRKKTGRTRCSRKKDTRMDTDVLGNTAKYSTEPLTILSSL